MRPHVAAVYAFARVADDIADEGTAPADERLAQLDAWQRRLHAARRRRTRSDGAPHAHEDLIVVALAHSIRSLDLPLALFDDLLSAFGQDTMTTRYASWADVFDYCRRSANPVGRLVLRIAGYRDEALDRSSDALCTALQLTNFWQDFGRDWRAGRLYVPRDVQRACRRATKPICDGRPLHRRRGRAALDAVRRASRATCSRRAARSATASAAGCASSCGSPGSAARGSSSASSAAGADAAARTGRRSARADVPLLLLARGALAARGRLMARKTSFYYSFLVLPAEQRRAIIAVWDFCRAVDDAVDEEPTAAAGGCRPAREAVAFWRESWRACYDGGAPATPQGRRLQPFVARVRPAAPGVRGRDRRRRDGSRHDALPDVRRSVRVLPPRRVGGRPDLHPDLRLPQRRARATTR